MQSKTIRIGGGSGFWGDSAEGPRQLVMTGEIDYLAMDYMAEVTMSILARVREKKPDLGYAPDFVTDVIRPLAKELSARKIKLICNAGGVNPLACAAAVRAELALQGVDLQVAAVLGDDSMPYLDKLRDNDVREMFTGQPIPKLLTANAYLGAFPIAQALDNGADIVITGRCADSAVALGPLIHEFKWMPEDLDKLASGSLAGHVIECGPQTTGGFFTDWQQVSDGWADIGFPIVECREDGSFIATKAANTGGLVSFGTVAEQITYETGDPSNYILADVVCDLSSVKLKQLGPDQIEVSNVKGRPPTPFYKVSGTLQDGYRSLATLLIRGREAIPKSRAVAAAIIKRTETIFARNGMAAYDEVSIEVLGAEEPYVDAPAVQDRREAVLKIAVRHKDARALDIFSREIYPASTGTVQGVCGVFGGRPKVQPMVRLFSFLVPKEMHEITVHTQASVSPVPTVTTKTMNTKEVHLELPVFESAKGPQVVVPLVAIAYGRSGDKGNLSNVAILARRPEFLSAIAEQLTETAVATWMRKLVDGKVVRYYWPGLNGFNFLLHEALSGGGVASLRYDPQGKAHGQILLDHPIRIPARWVEEGWVDKELVLKN